MPYNPSMPMLEVVAAGLPTAAALNSPEGIAWDSAGNAYITEAGGHRVRKIDATTGNISTICGTGVASSTGDSGLATAATINQPYGIAVDAVNNVYIGEVAGRRIRKIDAATGKIATICGSGVASSTGDGGAPSATTIFDSRHLLFSKANNRLYTVDGVGNGVRVIQ